MARARNIKPGFFQNEELADLSCMDRLVFIGLWTVADFKGCIAFRPKRLKVAIMPYDNCNIEESVLRLNKSGFVRIYSVLGQRYLKIDNFTKHQRPHKNEIATGSDIPDEFDADSLNIAIEEDTEESELSPNESELSPNESELSPNESGPVVPLPSSLFPLPPSPLRIPSPPASAFGKPREIKANHPALVAVRNLTGHQPDPATWDALIEILGMEPDLPRLAASYSAWVLKGYKKSNYAWISEWYVNGIEEQQNEKRYPTLEEREKEHQEHLALPRKRPDGSIYVPGVPEQG